MEQGIGADMQPQYLGYTDKTLEPSKSKRNESNLTVMTLGSGDLLKASRSSASLNETNPTHFPATVDVTDLVS